MKTFLEGLKEIKEEKKCEETIETVLFVQKCLKYVSTYDFEGGEREKFSPTHENFPLHHHHLYERGSEFVERENFERKHRNKSEPQMTHVNRQK